MLRSYRSTRFNVSAARLFRLMLIIACLGIGIFRGHAAIAGNIDQELLRHSKDILRKVKERGYQSIGILKFRVQRGSNPASFDVGRLNSSMATRLENALILGNDLDAPVKVARDCSTVASAPNHLANYTSKGGREALFKETYPLAWGDESVSLDAFLTGTVSVSENMRVMTIVIEMFDKSTFELAKLTSFTVPTDRSAISDVSASFMLARRSLVKRGDDLDKDAADDAAHKLSQQPDSKATADNIQFDLQVLYDGKPQLALPDQPTNLEKAFPSPKQGQKVAFRVRSSERVGIVILVNGMNTLLKEEDDMDPVQYSKWVLSPNTSYDINGYYLEDMKTLENFRVLSEEDSAAYPLLNPAKRGLVEIYVFQEGAALNNQQVSLRGVPKDRPLSLKDLQTQVRKQTRGRIIKSGILVPGTAEKVDLQSSDFANPKQVGAQIIRLYR